MPRSLTRRPTSVAPRSALRGRTAPLALGLAALLTLTACAGEAEEAEDGPEGLGATTETEGEAEGISEERCADNEAAGTITYVTGYQYQASAGILEAIAADALGYFEEVCLTVEIQPGTGDTAGNAQLVAAGTAQVTSLGGEAEILKAVANDIDVVNVLTWGHVPIATLMTSPEVTDLTELDGTILGHKGALPAPLRAMLVEAGADVDSLELVQVGYDPSVLPRGQVDSLTGYKSNEPVLLESMGEEVTSWNPEDYGVPGSFGNLAVSPAFAAEHPTAVEDYLRALMHAFEYCVENGAECVGYAEELSDAGYDAEHNLRIWEVESALVTDSTPAGQPLGYIDTDLTLAEGQTLIDSGELTELPEVEGLFDSSFLEAIHEGDVLIWPAP